MNAKKKNKKANKPPNPNPPQNLEKVPKPTESVQEIQPKCEVKEEPAIKPEIVSEVAATPVSDVKDFESEIPKKPKRNKGKKKKQDKDEEFIEDLQEIQEVQIESNVKTEEPVQKAVAEEKQLEDKKDPLDEANVVPSARKKKNKKKSEDKPTEDPKVPDLVSAPGPKEDTTETISKTDLEVQELFSSTPELPKQDAKKKKNKKKNRTDSEKSDKSDNVVSCTSAFQKLLVEDEISKQDKPVITAQSTQELITNLPLDSKSKITDTVAKSNVETLPVDVVNKLIPTEPQEVKEFPKDESKGKKKNKKDKKQQHKEIVEELKLNISEEMPTAAADILAPIIPADESKQDINKSIEAQLDLETQKEPSPKLKAKIAKPVEKKRKGKLDAQSSENISSIESSAPVKEDKKVTGTSKESDSKLIETLAADIITAQNLDQIVPTASVVLETMDSINPPSDSTMGKKRKKSPKPPKTDHLHKEKAAIVELPENIQSKKSEITESAITILDLIQPEMATHKSEEMKPKIVEVLPGELLKPLEYQKIDSSETNVLVRAVTPEMKMDDEGFEIKTSKKKKKMPKIPQVKETSESKESIEPPVIKNQDEIQEKPNLTEEKKELPLDTSLSADLEIRSVRTESEASSCDVIPDVLFMRSSSQHLLDSNNNTVIQELAFVDEMKLNEPLLLPFIEGSGETPAHTPEPVASGIRMTEIVTKTPAEEKTDIKSKIIEVNQDMEELRLSIERSLAEFTTLEKCEEESEKKQEIKIAKEKSPQMDKRVESPTSLKKVKSSPKESKNNAKIIEETTSTTELKENIPAKVDAKESENLSLAPPVEPLQPIEAPPICPTRKDNKGKSKSKKKGKQEGTSTPTPTASADTDTTKSQSKDKAENTKQETSEEKSDQKTETTQEKGKQQSVSADDSNDTNTNKDIDNEKQSTNADFIPDTTQQNEFDPIENFEDALTSSIDDVNITFEMIAKDADNENIEFQKKLGANKPEINITEPVDDTDTDTKRNEKINPVSQPKNLLGQIDFPVQSNKTDYKKEKNKTPNARQARVKIKDSMDVEAKKKCKESQTDSKRTRKNSDKSVKESFSRVKSDTDEYVYKYSFRKVFLQSACHVCNKDLSKVRVPCGYCSLVFYCGSKHKDDDWPQHQALCFAVSTLAHMKDQKHIYADAQNITGQDYRLLRMQMIVSCEKVLKRRLVPWEQEAMLYPRICADVACREWRQGKLNDCEGCGQLSYCAAHPEHLPKSHSRWCKSYSLYQKLVSYQQTKGRLEPRLPTKVMVDYDMPGKMNEVLAAMYEEKIDMNDIQYASLTQLATAPLTTAYCLQLCRTATVRGFTNGVHKKQPFTIHVVGAELQFEADALNKWETFFLHLRPDVAELRVVLVSPMLNPGNLPLDLLGRIKLCDDCVQNKRRVVFQFEDNKNYSEYRSSEDFINPDIICAFNPSIQRSSVYNGKDPWPAIINSILKLKQPFIISSYTLNELRKDIARVNQVAEMGFKLVSEPGFNSFASVRPDRNFISDDEMPLLFKNYCVAVVLGC